MSDAVIRTLLTIAFGALAGGTTNAIAVWMLFHPYEPPRLFGRRIGSLQGAIPKNKQRLAAAMGRTVGTKLLTPADLARTVTESGFRDEFERRLHELLVSVFERERGSVSSLLSPAATAELRSLLLNAGHGLLEQADGWVRSDEFRAAVERWVELLKEELAHVAVGELFTEERRGAVTRAVDRWLEDAASSESFETAIRDYVNRGTERVLQPERTFEQLLPTTLVAAVEKAIAGYLPIAIERLGGMLDDPGARARVEQVLHELLDRFMRDLRFHQRLVAALLITPDTIDRVLRAVEQEGAAKISELLHDPSVQDAMARGVNNAVVEFLARPVVDVLGHPGDETVENTKATVVTWVLTLARDPQTRSFAVEKLHDLLEKTHGRTWGDLLEHVPSDRIAEGIADAAASERARELGEDAVAAIVDALLERPIGRLSDRLGDDVVRRTEAALAEPLWAWLQEQLPKVASRLDIERRVEQKILDFPTKQLEDLVRGVTERELQLIVRLGYLLGGLIGVVSAIIATLFS